MLKKILGFAIVLLMFISKVQAEKFVIGEYVPNMEVKMYNSSRTKQFTIQILRSENGDITYCIEPFILLDQSIEYNELTDNINDTINISESDLELIKLISFYGYGYGNRTDPFWYAITQLMIWRIASPDATINFIKSGSVTNDYDSYINEIMEDVNRDLTIPNLSDSYTVNITSNLNLEVTDNYIISSDSFNITNSGNTYSLRSVRNSGIVDLKRINNNYDRNFGVFTGSTSQKLVKRGNFEYLKKQININCVSGSIRINVIGDLPDDFVISYKLTNNRFISYNVNVGKGTKLYEKLPYYTYDLIIKSLSDGYYMDKTLFRVSINEDRPDAVIDLVINKKTTKVTIKDYLCNNGECSNNPNTNLELYDSNMNLIDEYVTDDEGIINIDLSNGIYYVYQEQITGYNPVDVLRIDINNEEELTYEIYNEKSIIEEESIEIEPPETGIDDLKISLILSLSIIGVIKVVKKF